MGLFWKKDKEDNFIKQLRLQVEKTAACVDYLEKNLNNINDDIIRQHNELIDEIIEIKMVLMDDLHNTFITPIDREDIYHISVCLLEFAKYAQTTLEEIYLLNVKPDECIKNMIAKVNEETHELSLAISRLMKNPRIAYEHIVNVTKLETKIDKSYRNNIKLLFDNNEKLNTNFQNILRLREIYRHISNMSDKAEDVANALGMALIKLS